MNNIFLDNELNKKCTSCSACFSVCPFDAIEFGLSDEGFYRPSLILDKCKDCGLCKKVCYTQDQDILKDENPEEYLCASLKSNDSKILSSSSSGGACFELAKALIKNGYRIIGVAYDEELCEAVGILFDDLNDFHKIQGSKYFQSDISKVLKQAVNDKESKIAIFGLPCQIYGFRKVIQALNLSDRFVLVDIFCHGAPTVKLWKKYFDFVKKSLKAEKIDKISFRSKAKGWHRFCTTFFYDGKEKTSKIINDEFYTLFFGKDLFNNSCYACKLRSTLRYTDIRMADFWGSRYDTDTKGVSAVVASSEKGKSILKEVDPSAILKTGLSFKEVVAAQSYGEIHSLKTKRREILLQKINDSSSDISEILKIYKKNLSSKERLVLLKKNFIKAFPLSFSNALKKVYHKIKFK